MTFGKTLTGIIGTVITVFTLGCAKQTAILPEGAEIYHEGRYLVSSLCAKSGYYLTLNDILNGQKITIMDFGNNGRIDRVEITANTNNGRGFIEEHKDELKRWQKVYSSCKGDIREVSEYYRRNSL